MRFRLWTILYAFALLAAAMATFGGWGAALAVVIAILWGLRLAPDALRPRWVFLAIIVVTLATLVLGALLPWMGSAVQGGRRIACTNNMKHLALALLLYSEKHGTLPPAYLPDQDGKPMHSWRVLVLPYLERQDLYDRYDFDEPWDGPNNRKLWNEMPDVFSCPSAELARQRGILDSSEFSASYFAVVDPKTIWRGNAAIQTRAAIPDGTANTMMLIESVQPTCWMQPRDLSMDEAVRQLTGDAGVGHAYVFDGLLSVKATCRGCTTAFADGHAEYLSNVIPQSLAKALLTHAGGEEIDVNDKTGWRQQRKSLSARIVKWPKVYSFGLFVVLALLPAIRLFRRAPGHSEAGSIKPP